MEKRREADVRRLIRADARRVTMSSFLFGASDRLPTYFFD